MKVIQQHDIRDCGAACLSMIASHYGLKLPVSKCRELTKTDRTGTNLYGLADGARQIGLNAEALSGSSNELLDSIQKEQVHFPFVAHIISDNAMLHYIVIFGLSNGKFVAGDPVKGKVLLPVNVFFGIWTGYIVTFEKTDKFRTGNETHGSFRKFFSLLKGQYRKLIGVLLLSLIAGTIGIVGAFVFEIAIDEFAADTGYYDSTSEKTEDEHEHTENKSHNHEGDEKHNIFECFLEDVIESVAQVRFHVVFILLIALYLLQALIQFVRGYLIASISKKLDIQLSLSYYNHIVDLPVSSIAVRQTGEYLSRFSDTSTIRIAISGATVTLLLDSVMALACGYILYTQNKTMFLVSLLMVALYAAIVLSYRKLVERSNREAMESNAQLQSYFKESIDGIETVKAACANQQIKQKMDSKFNRFINAVFKNSLISLSQDTLVDLVELIGTVVILWIGFYMVLANRITIGTLITFYILLSYFTTPIKNLIELQPTIQTAFVAADRLNDILNLQCEAVQSIERPLPNIDTWELRNVDFRYGNRELTLENVSLLLRRGEKVAIVGESGSGKTTLAKLLLRFYEPECGTILINGEDIKKTDPATLRQAVSYISQNTFLFSDTVKNNLTLGNPGVSDLEIEQACRISKADEFISKLPFGFDTILDENGLNLSGGQRQRLAIARALLKKPQLLIMDEATSNLDMITEATIKETIDQFDRNITCIIIAHRLNTIKNCDRIYVMADGHIEASGTHKELLRTNEKYAFLWRNQ